MGAADAELKSLLEDCPQYWSAPEKSLIPRHAYLVARGLPSGRQLLLHEQRGLWTLLLRPKSDLQFAEAVCTYGAASSADAVSADFGRFARTFRKGGLDAARAGDVSVLTALETHGYDPASDRDRRGASVLHYAAGHGHVDCCAWACEHGGLGVDDRASDGATPLHWAVAGMRSQRSSGMSSGFGTGGHQRAASWLVDRGADPRACTHVGNSVLHWCAWAGGQQAFEWLADHLGAEDGMHALNSKGCSAAHWAASGGDLAVCRLLAETRGVDFSAPNLEGNTPLTKAIEHQRAPVVQWLLESGRCGAAVTDAAGYAARLAARHSADATTNEISELMQSYLLARYYLRQRELSWAPPTAMAIPAPVPAHTSVARSDRYATSDRTHSAANQAIAAVQRQLRQCSEQLAEVPSPPPLELLEAVTKCAQALGALEDAHRSDRGLLQM
uniref:Uncharacterized protein n=1 Tax=Calcidiscus leptoporus TaxID=127549 RepID=A0A7S0NRB7_9EUKA